MNNVSAATIEGHPWTPEELDALEKRVQEATGPDRSLDWNAHFTLLGIEGVGMYGAHPAYTASVDATLALAERVLVSADLCRHAADLVSDGLKDMHIRGFQPNQPLAPQLARSILSALIAALRAKAGA